MTFCRGCNKPLTDEEIEYYEHSCNDCEVEELERYQRWRHGGEDEELDKLYSEPEPTKH